MDEVKPQDLSMSFLREFMNLPTSSFLAGGPLKYRKVPCNDSWMNVKHQLSIKKLCPDFDRQVVRKWL